MKHSELKQMIKEEIEKELSSNSRGMKVKDLKLYGKYKDIRFPNREYIYIGISNRDEYWFLYKNEGDNTTSLTLIYYGFNPKQIVKNLNLETFINYNGKYIKDYDRNYLSKEEIEKYIKPI
jgi:hypothetical protein